MSDITVSTDVDTMLRSANNAAILTNTGAAPTASPTFTGDATIPKIIATEIQCVGTTSGTAQPIKYDSLEHRFRDYDESPTNLMVIKKIDGSTGARIGINKDTADAALHIVAGTTSGTEDTALKVVGGAFFEDYVRIGHYTTAGRPTSPTNGSVIYNTTLHKFQGYIGGGGGWKSFQMES